MDLAKEPIPLADIWKSWVQSDIKLLSQVYAHLGSCCCILGDSGAIVRNESRELTLYGFLYVKCLYGYPGDSGFLTSSSVPVVVPTVWLWQCICARWTALKYIVAPQGLKYVRYNLTLRIRRCTGVVNMLMHSLTW
jgi:hypothetical protein